jgi:hypothetical protein
MDAAVDTPGACAVYRRRRPEHTPLYRTVRGHLETDLAQAQEGQGGGVPPYVEGGFAATSNATSWLTVSRVPAAGTADTIS